jgi:hypothetical protein
MALMKAQIIQKEIFGLNQEIGYLLGYSSETIRKKINKITTRVYHENKIKNNN